MELLFFYLFDQLLVIFSLGGLYLGRAKTFIALVKGTNAPRGWRQTAGDICNKLLCNPGINLSLDFFI